MPEPKFGTDFVLEFVMMTTAAHDFWDDNILMVTMWKLYFAILFWFLDAKVKPAKRKKT